MRFINWLCRFIVFAGLVGVAALGFLYTRDQIFEVIFSNYDKLKELLQIPGDFPFRIPIAIGCGAIAILLAWTLIPPRRKDREFSFAGSHGEVSIAIEPVEATLNRVVSKLPDVKWIELSVKPVEGMDKIRIHGNAVLYKDADGDARMITARVLNFITQHARKILGVTDIEPKIKVKRWVMRMKTVKTEPLLLQAPSEEEAPVSRVSKPAVISRASVELEPEPEEFEEEETELVEVEEVEEQAPAPAKSGDDDDPWKSPRSEDLIIEHNKRT